MNDNETKGLCIALLFVDTLLFGWPPYLLVHTRNQSSRSVRIRTAIISYLTCFSGGVFLGACLLHLLAEGRETMEDYFTSIGKDMDFPVYECVLACGFFAIAIVEQVAHNLLHSRTSTTDAPSEAAGDQQGSGVYSLKSHEEQPVFDHVGHYNQAFYPDPQFQAANGNEALASIKNGHIHAAGDRVYPSVPAGDVAPATHSAVILQHTHLKNEHDADSEHEHDAEMVQAIQAMHVNPLRAFLLLGALSFHTIFDGLAVGLQDSGTNIWEMFAAICIHKSLVAVCLGLQLFLAFKSRPIMAFIWVFVFSVISPIGVGLGMIITSGNINEDAENLASWILQGMATGTFLYVTVFEILREEFTERGSVLKIFVSIIGFGGMAVAKYFDKD
ncbi:hypothetical protein BsWGS_27557 [Bradybaena similaris]